MVVDELSWTGVFVSPCFNDGTVLARHKWHQDRVGHRHHYHGNTGVWIAAN